jgi:hypothetical protein
MWVNWVPPWRNQKLQLKKLVTTKNNPNWITCWATPLAT